MEVEPVVKIGLRLSLCRPWRIEGLLSLHVQGRRKRASPYTRTEADAETILTSKEVYEQASFHRTVDSILRHRRKRGFPSRGPDRTGSAYNEYATRMAILKFTEGVGDPNPLWSDSEYAKNSPYGSIIAEDWRIVVN